MLSQIEGSKKQFVEAVDSLAEREANILKLEDRVAKLQKANDSEE